MPINKRLHNVNIRTRGLLPTPNQVREDFPLTQNAEKTVLQGRTAIRAILEKNDTRKLLIVGPCSIHDLGAAKEYAHKLKELSSKIESQFVTVMRVYFEKPRTTTGWKGFINDPSLDESCDISTGVKLARELLLELAELGLPAGTEALDPIVPQYVADLISWYAIGARTTESQTHRELASGLSAPVGIKNGTDGSIQVATNALKSVAHPHNFLGITGDGQCAVYETTGNQHGHIVLRGGKQPNYDSVNVKNCEDQLRAAGLAANIMIDCSHGNSSKDHTRQPLVLEDCINQIKAGNKSIIGFMLESNLSEGKQSINGNPNKLTYGVSVTDACIDWKQTEDLLLAACEKLEDS